MTNYYSYQDLAKAAKKNPSNENLKALAEWADRYDISNWSGECYCFEDIDLRFRPTETEGEYEVLY